ncbi:hypothetical protein BD289DRAFT_131946 [Coniella lustricola]|uniref:Secreted protein n=1 Tax=Coniella lustricola TaxID=2025994 RepID=A0A2T3AFQ3_9PEZI|nr:hypothetical protein BD289DRAFT_131946 [Coniella lustricola]
MRVFFFLFFFSFNWFAIIHDQRPSTHGTALDLFFRDWTGQSRFWLFVFSFPGEGGEESLIRLSRYPSGLFVLVNPFARFLLLFYYYNHYYHHTFPHSLSFEVEVWDVLWASD